MGTINITYAADNNTLHSRVLQALAQQTQKHFYFRQSKKIAVLNKPLITEGELTIQDAMSGVPPTIIWETQKPYHIRYELGRDNIRETDDNGTRTFDAASSPLAAALADLLMVAFSGHWENREDLARIEASGTFDHWHLDITPQSITLQQLINQMSVDGSQQSLRVINIFESNRDRTTIELSSEP